MVTRRVLTTGVASATTPEMRRQLNDTVAPAAYAAMVEKNVPASPFLELAVGAKPERLSGYGSRSSFTLPNGLATTVEIAAPATK